MLIAENFFDSTPSHSAATGGVLRRRLWLATAFWAQGRARRIDDPWLVGMAALLGLVPPFVGPIIYLFLRPPDSIEERRDRELENRARGATRGERPALPRLPRPGRRLVPRLSRLHDPAEAGLAARAAPARTDLAGLPVLRDCRAPGKRRGGRVLQPLRVRRTS
jgi:hypothetical protein